MKATGIVRRIDDLGRVVIPKEIRRTQLIRVGDPLEIFVSAEGEVIFKKYSPVGEIAPFAQLCTEVLQRACSVAVLVTDRDRPVAALSGAHAMLERRVTPEYDALMQQRRFVQLPVPMPVCAGADAPAAAAAAPILCEGDLIGSVALLQQCTDSAAALLRATAALLGRQMET